VVPPNRYLSMVEHQRIAGLHRQGLTVREIAAAGAQPVHGEPGATTQHRPRTMSPPTPCSSIYGRASVAPSWP
jgi:hypothetical protein